MKQHSRTPARRISKKTCPRWSAFSASPRTRRSSAGRSVRRFRLRRHRVPLTSTTCRAGWRTSASAAPCPNFGAPRYSNTDAADYPTRLAVGESRTSIANYALRSSRRRRPACHVRPAPQTRARTRCSLPAPAARGRDAGRVQHPGQARRRTRRRVLGCQLPPFGGITPLASRRSATPRNVNP